jgi:hypothetical protein
MRTLQEKYNGINEGKFSKDQFLRDVRMEQPTLVTQYNGYDDAVQILKNRGMIQEVKIEEARLTNKSLTDYRYKPTNDMDKYPYEQILRGLRVELEGLNVLGTPTPEEYTKALGKVLKNLEKDTIFYTNQVAGVKANAKRTDLMVDATPKNEVDKENGLKKAALKEAKGPDIQELVLKLLKKNPSMTWTQAMKKVKEDLKDNKSQKDQLKEAIKGVIKNILSENPNPDLYDQDEERQERANDHGDYGPVSDFGDYYPEPDEDLYEMQSEKSDSDYRNELNDFLEDHQIYGYTGKIHDIMTGPDESTAAQELEAYLEDNQIYGRTYLTGILDIYADYPYDQHWQNQPDEDEADDISHPRGYEEASDEESFDDLMEANTEEDIRRIKKYAERYEVANSDFERIYRQMQNAIKDPKTTDPTRLTFKHEVSLMDKGKAFALQSMANQDNYQAGIEGMDESISLKDIL